MYLQEMIVIGLGPHGPPAFLARHPLWISGNPMMFCLEVVSDFCFCKGVCATIDRALVLGIRQTITEVVEA